MSGRDAFRRATDRLRAVARAIQTQQEIEHSFRSAQKKQFKMLPDPPMHTGFDFACYYNAAETLSGDFYDFIPLGDGLTGIVVGDVTGHGLEAAVIMACAKKAISILAHTSTSPREVLASANDNLLPDLDDMTFVSVFYGILDRNTRTLVHVRAGHNPTLLVNPAREPMTVELKPRGIVIGMQRGDMFERLTEEHRITLQPGDIVVQYTDGVLEAKNLEGVEYGKERFTQVVCDHLGEPMHAVFDRIIEDLTRFRGAAPLEDDVTLVGFRVLATPDTLPPGGSMAQSAEVGLETIVDPEILVDTSEESAPPA